MKNKDYWKKRAENISNYEFEKADDYKLKLEEEYKKAWKTIQALITAFYCKFAKDNKISIIEARKLLNYDELKEFKTSLNEFAEKAKNNENLQWENELNKLSNKVRITRLESLQVQLKGHMEDLHSKQTQDTTNLLKDIYSDSYYRNIFEIHKGLGIGVNFARVDNKAIEKVLKEPWHENNYSSRIWNNKKLLINELQSNLTQSFIRGDSIDKTSKIIANRMNVGIGRARTLVNTESAYISSKATLDGYSNSGVLKQYEILATLDLHTSKVCRRMDGKVFDLKEKKIGINAPPFHPNCRSTTIPYFDDAIDEERIARDPVTGKNKYVPGNMKYEDWYKENVANNPKALAEEKKIQNKASDKKQHEKYKEVLGKEVPKSFDKFQELKYNSTKEWKEIKEYFSYKVDNPESDKTYFLINKKLQELRDSGVIRIKGTVVKPKVQPIKELNEHTLMRMDQRRIGKDDTQSFIDNSIIAFKQRLGTQYAYYSEKGFTAMSTNGMVGSTGWLDENGKIIIKEAKKILCGE